MKNGGAWRYDSLDILLKTQNPRSGKGTASNSSTDLRVPESGYVVTVIDATHIKFKFELEQEVDGRWIAEIVDLPGVMAYGKNKEEAIAYASALALRVVADRIEEQKQPRASIEFACA